MVRSNQNEYGKGAVLSTYSLVLIHEMITSYLIRGKLLVLEST